MNSSLMPRTLEWLPRPSSHRRIRTHLLSARRTAATAMRHRKLLRVKPDPSYSTVLQTQDHIIYNPPSSAPYVYHTPALFLPQHDQRRRHLDAKLSAVNAQKKSAGPTATFKPESQPQTRLPPPVRKPYEKKYHLGEEQIAEIRRLRQEDPRQWTRNRLAEKFECSQLFVAIITEAPQAHQDEVHRQTDVVKSRWGAKRTMAREDRQRRKELWGRDA